MHRRSLLNESVEGRMGLVSAADCLRCPLHSEVHPDSVLGREGYTGRCLSSRAEAAHLEKGLDWRTVPCMDRALVERRRAEAKRIEVDLKELLK